MTQKKAGLRWTRTEDGRLMCAFDRGASIDQLARAHGRTRAAIEARLVRLGKMAPELPMGEECR